MRQFLEAQMREAIATLQALSQDETCVTGLLAAAGATARALQQGKKLLIAGNGGSAADSQHLAAEFISRLTIDRPAMRAIALTTDSSVLTAVGNDYGFETVFKRQIEALADEGDVLLAISTSGRSPNILAAMREARRRRVLTIGLTGESKNDMKELCDFYIPVPSTQTAHIQEAHLVLYHTFCGLVERHILGIEYFETRTHAAKTS